VEVGSEGAATCTEEVAVGAGEDVEGEGVWAEAAKDSVSPAHKASPRKRDRIGKDEDLRAAPLD